MEMLLRADMISCSYISQLQMEGRHVATQALKKGHANFILEDIKSAHSLINKEAKVEDFLQLFEIRIEGLCLNLRVI